MRLFIACGTQWRIVAGAGGAIWIGLDYPGVRAAAAMMAIDMDADLFERFRVLEHEALSNLNKKGR